MKPSVAYWFTYPANYAVIRFIEQFEERVDTLHQLAADLGRVPSIQMHRDASDSAVVQAGPGRRRRRLSIGVEQAHPVYERAARRGAFDQFNFRAIRDLAFLVRPLSVYSIVRSDFDRTAPDRGQFRMRKMIQFARRAGRRCGRGAMRMRRGLPGGYPKSGHAHGGASQGGRIDA